MDARIAELVARLTALERERAEIVAEIDTLRSARSGKTAAIKVVPSAKAGDPIDRNSSIEKKIALFRRLFRGRSDVFPIAELTSHHIALPRGCFDAVRDLLASVGIAVTVEDCCTTGAPIPFAFVGALRPNQEQAVAALLPHDTGVLAATTAFGKTILAIRMMAERGVNTLILVHRRQLMDQ